MKIEEVPQDGRYLTGTIVRDVYYVLNEQNDYEQALSVGWETKNDALALTWENISEEAEEIRREVLEGKQSPLAYHMKMSLLNIGMLSSYTDIPKRKIRKHLTNDEFKMLENSTLELYAKAMNLTVEELKKV